MLRPNPRRVVAPSVFKWGSAVTCSQFTIIVLVLRSHKGPTTEASCELKREAFAIAAVNFLHKML